MKTFSVFVENQVLQHRLAQHDRYVATPRYWDDDPLLESFAFIGKMVKAKDCSIMEAEQSQSAVEFIQMFAADIRQAPQHLRELLGSLHPDGLQDLRRKLSVKLHTMLPAFEQHYEKIKAMAEGGPAKPQQEAFEWIWQGFKWLVQKILAPVLSLALRSIRKTLEVFLIPMDYAKSMGEHGPMGVAGGFMAGLGYLALSVLLLPYLMTLGAPVAIGGFAGIWTLYWWVMEWFKRNILGPAIQFSEGA